MLDERPLVGNSGTIVRNILLLEAYNNGPQNKCADMTVIPAKLQGSSDTSIIVVAGSVFGPAMFFSKNIEARSESPKAYSSAAHGGLYRGVRGGDFRSGL